MNRKLALGLVAALALAACSTDKPEDSATTESQPAPTEAAATTAAPADEGTETETTAAPADDGTDEDVTETTEAAPESTEAPTPTFEPVVDDRAPGVTDTSVKVGVMYLNLEGVKAILGIDQGDYQAAYAAAIAEVNDNGGVNGRMLDPVYVEIVPNTSDAGTVACTKLTDDENVFVALGSFIGDDAQCFITTHETPLLGGGLETDVLAASKALWLSPDAAGDVNSAALQLLVDSGVFDGKKVGVVGQAGLDAFYAATFAPILESGGVDVVDVGYIDVIGKSSDPNALYTEAETVSLKFQSEDIDTILMVNGVGTLFPNGLARTNYRPTLVFGELSSASTYSGGDGSDLSVMAGAAAAGPYDAGNLFRELGSPTAECVASQEARLGVTLLASKDVPEGEPDYFVSSLIACRYVGLLVDLLEAAGPDLNWGTFTTAGYNLGEVMLPGYADPFYFDKDHPNGSPRLYLYGWDEAAEDFAPQG